MRVKRKSMRAFALTCAAVLIAFAVAPTLPATAASGSSYVIQYWYSWGTNVVGGAQVRSFIASNLTMNATLPDQAGVQTKEITEFHIYATTPGKDRYPSANGTNPFPFPQVTAFYDTIKIIRDPKQCTSANNSVGFVCNAPQVNWQHQVLEVRFLRAFEFTDTKGDGGYHGGEPILSQTSLADASLHFSTFRLDGLNDTSGVVALPLRINVTAVDGTRSDGWSGQNERSFRRLDGLTFSMSAGGPFNLTVTGYQWFRPRSFSGNNLTSSSAKLELGVDSYPFKSSNSRLALELRVTSFSQNSAGNWGVVPWPNGRAVGSETANTTAVFAWSSTADADGRRAPVVDTIAPIDALSRGVYLSYPRASRIHHDPVLAIADKRVEGSFTLTPPAPYVVSAWLVFGATLVATAAVILVLERRKR
jgi:hypothetical protein